MKGPLREPIPLGAQQVRLKLPAGLKAKKVHLLVSGQTPRVGQAAGYVTLTVPSILYHEVVAVEV